MEATNLNTSSFSLKWQCIILFGFAFLLYANTITHQFAWDDQLVITQNTATIKGLKGLKEIWTSYAYLEGREIYRPIPQTIHAFVWSIFPDSPKTHHLINIFFYSFCCVSLLILFRKAFDKVNHLVLFLSAILFTLLPIHTEVVANIKSMDEVLSGLFVIWSCFFFLKKNKTSFIIGSVLLAAACLSKISAITILPLLILIPFQDGISSLIDKVKKLTFSDYIAPVASIILLVFTLYNYLHKDIGNFKTIIPLMIAITLTLWIKFRIPRTLLFFLALIGLSYFLRWDFALIVFIPFFFQDLKNNKVTWIELAVKFAAFIVITMVLDYNSTFLSVILTGIFTFFYFMHKRTIVQEKFVKYFSYVALAALIFLSMVSREYKVFLIAFVLISYLSIFLKKRTLITTSVLLIFTMFVSEYVAFNIDYNKKPVVAPQEIIQEVKEEFTLQNAINPYHNILIIEESKSVKYATICRIQLVYLQKLILPTALVHQHGTWQIKLASWKDWDVYLSILIHVLLLFLALYCYKRKYNTVMWGIIWYFISISIYTNIIRLMPDTLAERFLFLPSIGFSVAFVSGLFYLIKKIQKEERKSLITLGIVLLPLFGYYAIKTIDRNKDWENNYTLAANTLPAAQNNAAINAQYALELNNLIKYEQISNVDSAKTLVVEHYKKSIDIFPNFYAPNADLASYYIIEAQPDMAFPYLLESTRLNPSEWIHHYYLGLIYYERNNYSKGVEHFKNLIENKTLQERAREFPELLEAYEYSARCFHNIGKDKDAYLILEEAIGIFNQKSSYILLANLYRVTGKQNLAIATFKRLLSINPGDQELINTITYLEQGKIY